MTDKDIKDYCKNCDVEPPAMRFKCPECEHNTENENFAKDINVPSKEQIIIHGECVPVITLTRQQLEEDWYTLHQQLARKTQELKQIQEKYKARVKDLEERIINHSNTVEEYCSRLAKKEKECEELKEKLKFKVQENIKLSKENRNLKNWAHSKGVEIKVNRKIKETNLEEFCRMFRFKEMQAREEKLKEWQDFENDLQWKFYKNCKEWTEMRDKYNRYRKALEEIEEATKEISNYLNIGCDMDKCEDCNHFKPFCTNQCVCFLIGQGASILDIINKVKGTGNGLS